MANPDANVPLGVVHDHEGEPLTVRRDFDELVIPAMTLRPDGVTVLERRIGDYRNAVARFRLRELDLDDIDLSEARDDLADIPGLADESEPRNLELADWVEAAARLRAMRHIGGYQELRKLAAVLMADEVPATERPATDGPKWVEKLSLACSSDEDGRCRWQFCGCVCHTDVCAGCGGPAGFEFTPIENGRAICKQCAAAATGAAS